MKNKLRLFLFLALTLLLIASVIGCGKSYTQESLDTAWDLAYAAGHEIGYTEGEAEGYHTGYTEGYDTGLASLELAKQEESKVSFDKGYEDGYAKGKVESYAKGYEAGYDDGLSYTADAPPSITPPEEITTPPPTEPEEEQVIEDLAYIKAFSMPYSDDADPEWEGVSIMVSYYNSKSERIFITGVPINVTIELYWYTNYPPIYHEQVTINYTGALTELLKEVIRIPFDGIQERPSGCTRNPILVAVVSTPTQGNFEDRGGYLLYWP